MGGNFIVNFNQDLIFTKTKCFKRGTEVKNPNDFKPQRCNFDLDNDSLEFLIEIQNEKLEEIKILKYGLHLIIPKHKNIGISIKSSKVNRIDGSNMCSIKIIANIKDRLLYLFENYQKEFELSISYVASGVKEKKSLKSLFYAALPIIKIQQYRYGKIKNIKRFNPKDFNGSNLMKIFDSGFIESKKSALSDTDKELLNDLLTYKKAGVNDRFHNFDFLRMFHCMVAIEDLEEKRALQQHNLNSARIFKYSSCSPDLQNTIDRYIKQLPTEFNEIIKKNHVIQADQNITVEIKDTETVNIFERKSSKISHKPAKTTGQIMYIIDNIILVRLYSTKLGKRFDKGFSSRIEFVPKKNSSYITHHAIYDMQKYEMSAYLETFEMKNMPIKTIETFTEFEWLNRSIKNNKKQQIAVKNIINCTSFPSPFIIFGGPGTGKSSTIVEAITQIVKLKPKSRILVTAGSNSTCDDLGNRLLKYISINKILRIYSPSFEKTQEKIDNVLKRVSNFQDGKKKNPSLEKIATARVVIATLTCTGRIVNCGISSSHFDYIFIDEAGSISEPNSYIPLSGSMISKNGEISSQIILSGDHKQLGPVVKSSFVSDLGFETSLMERLMNNDKKYQLINNEYNSKYVVQLKKNYRNHPAIMHFSNVHFYNSKLIPMCSKENKDFVSNLKLLPSNPQFPIIFHNTKFPSEQVGTSLKNDGELMILIHYLGVILKKTVKGKKIQQSDIGIISPYRGQRDCMNKLIGRKYSKVEVGTVDAFQGREKKIIILSCVRSQTSHVGFLSNEKRLNVALTRAKALVLIIGNVETLQKCRIWNKFIAYCRENKAIIGEMFNFKNIGDEIFEKIIEDEYET